MCNDGMEVQQWRRSKSVQADKKGEKNVLCNKLLKTTTKWCKYTRGEKNLPAIFAQETATAAAAAAASGWWHQSFTLANSHMYNMYNVYIVHNLHLVTHVSLGSRSTMCAPRARMAKLRQTTRPAGLHSRADLVGSASTTGTHKSKNIYTSKIHIYICWQPLQWQVISLWKILNMNKARFHRYFSLIKIRPNCPRQARYVLQPALVLSPLSLEDCGNNL